MSFFWDTLLLLCTLCLKKTNVNEKPFICNSLGLRKTSERLTESKGLDIHCKVCNRGIFGNFCYLQIKIMRHSQMSQNADSLTETSRTLHNALASTTSRPKVIGIASGSSTLTEQRARKEEGIQQIGVVMF
jgi:hypothetical protein